MLIVQLKAAGFTEAEIFARTQINPMDVAIERAWNSGRSNYREEAIKIVTKKKLQFISEPNCLPNLFTKFVSVTCPYCGGTTKPSFGGGAGNLQSMDYKCTECKAKVSLSLQHNAFFAQPS